MDEQRRLNGGMELLPQRGSGRCEWIAVGGASSSTDGRQLEVGGALEKVDSGRFVKTEDGVTRWAIHSRKYAKHTK